MAEEDQGGQDVQGEFLQHFGAPAAPVQQSEQPQASAAPNPEEGFLGRFANPDSPENRLASAREHYHHEFRTRGEQPGEYLGRRMVPFGSTIFNAAETTAYGLARRRIRENRAAEGDYDIAGRYEARQQHEQEAPFLERAASTVARVPGIAGEMAATGGMVAGPQLLTRAGLAGLGTAGGALMAGGRLAARTALAPSMYVEHAMNDNIAAGRDALDIRGVPPAFGVAMANTAVLGALAQNFGGVANPVARLGARTGAGVLEQGVTDLVTGAVGLQTGYGTLGDIYQGNYGQALQNASLQGLTFAAFALMHGNRREANELIKSMQSQLQREAGRGQPIDQAAQRISQANTALQEALERNPELTSVQAQELLKPFGNYGSTLAETVRRLVEHHPPQGLSPGIDRPVEAAANLAAPTERPGGPGPRPEAEAGRQGVETAPERSSGQPVPGDRLPSHVADVFRDVFPGAEASATRPGVMTARIGDRTMEMSYSPHSDAVRLDFGWTEATRAGMGQGLQPGSRGLVRSLGSFLEKLKETGTRIEYVANEAHAANYRRMLDRDDYQQIAGPTGDRGSPEARVWQPVRRSSENQAKYRELKKSGLSEQNARAFADAHFPPEPYERQRGALPLPAEAGPGRTPPGGGPRWPGEVREGARPEESRGTAQRDQAGVRDNLSATQASREGVQGESPQAGPGAPSAAAERIARMRQRQGLAAVPTPGGLAQAPRPGIRGQSAAERAAEVLRFAGREEMGRRAEAARPEAPQQKPGQLPKAEQQAAQGEAFLENINRQNIKHLKAGIDRALAEPTAENIGHVVGQIERAANVARKRGLDPARFLAEQKLNVGKLLEHIEKIPSPHEEINRGIAEIAARYGIEPASLRPGVEHGLQRANEAARTLAQGPRAGEQGAGEAHPPAAAGRGQAGGGELRPRSILAHAKDRGGISEESARNHGWDVAAMRETHPTTFHTHKSKQKGTRDPSEVAEELIREGLLTPRRGEYPHETLMRAIHEDTRVHSEAELAREQAEHERDKANAQKAGFSTKGIAGAAEQGQEIGRQSGAGQGEAGQGERLEGAAPQAAAKPRFDLRTGNLVGPGEEVYFHRGAGGRPPATGGAQPGPGPGQPRGIRPGGVRDSLQTLLAPASRGEEAGRMGGVLRQNLAELARKTEIAKAVLQAGKNHFDRLIATSPDQAARTEHFLQFTDAIERGEIASLPPELREIAQTIRQLTDQRTEQVRSRDLIHNFIENYLGHLWKKPGSTMTPEEIGRALGARRPLAGREGYKRERTIPTYRDGIEQGFEPVSWNPVELALMKLREVDKSVMAHDVFREMKDQGLTKFFRLGQRAPEGWTSFDDKMSKVFAPAHTNVREYFDRQQMEGLEEFARSLGITVRTEARGPAGMNLPGEIVRRLGTPEEVLAHEIGHALDRRYNLNSWAQNPHLRPELEALAEHRASGRVSEEYAAYLRSEPEVIANLVAAYIHAPELLQREAPNAFQAFDSFLQGHRETAALRDIKPSLELGEREQSMRLAGPMLTGNYYGPEPAMTLLNNHLSPGFRGNKAYDVAREFGNVLNQFQLGFSAFHAGFVAMDTQVSAAALGLQQISRGEFMRGLGNIARAPLAPVRAWMEGSKVLREYYRPGSQGAETAAIVDQLIQAGGRAKMDEFYGGTHVQRFRDALRDVRSGQTGRLGSLLYNALPAVADAISKPIMGVLVPRMKLGVFADMARFEMERLSQQGNQQISQREVLGRAWDSVENRLGQLTYDNLFWNRALKDTLMVGVRSVGWNLGTWRELGGGIKDIPAAMRGARTGEGISPRLAYLLALPMITALYGSMYQYLATGKGPDEPKDLFFPRTGRTRRDGSPDRVSLPSYVRDVAQVSNRAGEGPFRVAQNLWTMAKHKLHPALAIAAEMLSNENFYGTAIRNPNDSVVRQSWDTALHLIRAFESFSVRGAREQQQQQEGHGGIGMAAQGFIGITPAPAYVTRSSEQQRAMEAGRRTTLTPQERRRRGLR